MVVILGEGGWSPSIRSGDFKWCQEATCDAAARRAIEKTAPGCSGYIGDYTTQLFRDYDKPWHKDPY